MKAKVLGFTLVEILITLVVSSALVAGLGQILMQSKKTFQVQQGLSFVMEDGRYILEIITRETRRIGYLRNSEVKDINLLDPRAVGDATTVFVNDFDVLGSGINMYQGEFISGIYSAGGFNGTYDVNRLIFRYQLNDSQELGNNLEHMSPCTQLKTSLDPAIVNPDPEIVIHVASIYWYVGNDHVLYCKAKLEAIQPDGSVYSQDTPDASPLVSNVERFFVLYGLDVDADGSANVYKRADNIAPDWLNVVSLRLYVVLRSEEKGLAQNIASYRIEGQDVIPDNPEERRLYRVFSTTINLRNKS